MNYCKSCMMPDTKPDLSFDENGICNACNNFKNRDSINWDERQAEFLEIIEEYKSNSNWDCIVPVSGGKDSTFQVIKLLELGVSHYVLRLQPVIYPRLEEKISKILKI